MLLECVKGHEGEEGKEAGKRDLGCYEGVVDVEEGRCEFGFWQINSIDTNSFSGTSQVGRGEETGALTRGSKEAFQECAGGALPLCSGDMDDSKALKVFLGDSEGSQV